MAKIKKGDFIELDYTGKIKVGERVFDTSNEDVATSNNIKNSNMEYGPVTICVGESHVIKGLDKKLEGREIGKDYEFDIDPEDAFGKKNPKLMKTVSNSMFKKQNMNPYPGLQINADGMIGTVRSVTGGRVTLDFNHPLAGRDLIYNVKIIKLVEDVEQQVNSLLKASLFMLGKDNFNVEIVETELKITCKIKVPEQLQKPFEEKIKKLIPKIKKITFLEEKTK